MLCFSSPSSPQGLYIDLLTSVNTFLEHFISVLHVLECRLSVHNSIHYATECTLPLAEGMQWTNAGVSASGESEWVFQGFTALRCSVMQTEAAKGGACRRPLPLL